METLNTQHQTQIKIIYGEKEFGDLVVQVSNYGIDISKKNERYVGGLQQLCFFSYLNPLTQFLIECKEIRENPTTTIVYQEGIDNISYTQGEAKEFTDGNIE